MIPPLFERREITIPPGETIAPDSDWDDAIVVVEEGEIEVVGRHGATLRVREGGVLWVKGGALRALSNPGAVSTVLSAVRRVPSAPCA